jgi:hypothetical protein
MEHVLEVRLNGLECHLVVTHRLRHSGECDHVLIGRAGAIGNVGNGPAFCCL